MVSSPHHHHQSPPAASSGAQQRISHRLVKHPDNLSWGKEPSPRRGAPSTAASSGSIEAVAHVPSALDYFLSTSPRQSDKSIKQLLHSMDYGATKKITSELDRFERSHNAEMISDDDDDFVGDASLVGSPKQQRGGAGASVANTTPSGGGGLRLPLIGGPSASAGDGGGSSLNTSRIVAPGDEMAARPAQEYLPGKRVPVVSSNPITGILCNVPLHRVFSVYRDLFFKTVRQRRVSQSITHGASAIAAIPSKKDPMRLTVDDFMEILRAVLPPDAAGCVSREYARRMIEPFGTPSPYGGGTTKVPFPLVFSYLCKCFGHSVVEKNVRFLSKCLDPKNKGGIPYSVLTGRVVRAWAENRVIGGAIYGWRALASALEAAGDVDVRLLENPALITKDELRMIAYTTEALTLAMEVDLECDTTPAPRFPSLPNAKGSDDASSVVSGGRDGGRRGIL